jgi:hypothetical protein
MEINGVPSRTGGTGATTTSIRCWLCSQVTIHMPAAHARLERLIRIMVKAKRI